LFHSFGNTPPQVQKYQYEEEIEYYENGNQPEVNYYRMEYEQVEYGSAAHGTNSNPFAHLGFIHRG